LTNPQATQQKIIDICWKKRPRLTRACWAVKRNSVLS